MRLSRCLLVSLLFIFSIGGCSIGPASERIGDELFLTSRSGEVWSLLTDPTENGTLTSRFGYRRHPLTGLTRPHRGIDLAAPKGTPVVAAADGVLLFQGDRGTYGNLSRIKHGRDVVTAYAHLDRFVLGLVPGMHVQKGQVIGYVGTSGQSSGPHLHYEVIMHGHWIDPLGLIETQLAGGTDLGPSDSEDRFEIALRSLSDDGSDEGL
ncbi:MAG: M23 family metallopeptidase [Pseudomonadota bacterium]